MMYFSDNLSAFQLYVYEYFYHPFKNKSNKVCLSSSQSKKIVGSVILWQQVKRDDIILCDEEISVSSLTYCSEGILGETNEKCLRPKKMTTRLRWELSLSSFTAP